MARRDGLDHRRHAGGSYSASRHATIHRMWRANEVERGKNKQQSTTGVRIDAPEIVRGAGGGGEGARGGGGREIKITQQSTAGVRVDATESKEEGQGEGGQCAGG